MVCHGDALTSLVGGEPFGAEEPDDGVKWDVSVLANTPDPAPGLPIEKPDGHPWDVRIVAVVDRFVLCLRRRMGKRLLYPNEVVEREFGVAATTRGWDTLLRVCRVLESV